MIIVLQKRGHIFRKNREVDFKYLPLLTLEI